MSKNKMLTKAAGKALGDMLKANSVLKELDVSSNYDYYADSTDGAGFASGIADGVSTNGALVKFDVSKNNLGKEGTKALAEALNGNQIMAELNLAENSMGKNGAMDIAKTIPTMGALVKFDISNNNVYAAGGKALAAALNGNQVMTELNLAGNSLGLVEQYGDADMSGVIAVSDAIPTMGALTSLNVSNNQLCGLDKYGRGTYDASGVTALADAIGKHE